MTPRVLVIDDTLYWSRGQRRRFLTRLRAADETGGPFDDAPTVAEPTARMVFCPGQRIEGSRLVNDVEVALAAVAGGWRADRERWALILLDMLFDPVRFAGARPDPDRADGWETVPGERYGEVFGPSVLEAIETRWPDRRGLGPEPPVVVLSNLERGQGAGPASRAGALAFVEKSSLDADELCELLSESGLIEDAGGPGRSSLVGRSLPLLLALRTARNLGRRSANVLILGERGSGKSEIGRYVHQWSGRAGPYRTHFVSETTEQLEYAALFGAWEGAFTGADRSRPGVVEEAHGGTLLLDEVQALSPAAQTDLLELGRLTRAGRQLRRLGTLPRAATARREAVASVLGTLEPDTGRIAVDLLLLAASSEPLDDPEWRRGHRFLDPLYDRLATEYAGAPLRLPPLRERREDVPAIFAHALASASVEMGGVWPKLVDSEVLDALSSRAWGGNVAELAGVARRVARVTLRLDHVYERHLEPEARPPTQAPDAAPARTREGLRRAIGELGRAELPPGTEELSGALAELEGATGAAAQLLVEQALREVARIHPDGFVLPALRLLLGESVASPKTTSEAYALLLRWAKVFPSRSPRSRELEQALERARANRVRR